MKKKFMNESYVEGFLYEHDLKIKVTGKDSKAPGTEFITGKVSIATDNNCTNIVDVHYTYVVATYASGAANGNYTVLKKIIDGELKTVMGAGKENASVVRIDSALALNEFYSNKTGQEVLVSAKRNEGGFIHVMGPAEMKQNEADRATFKCDMLITGCIRKDADEERGIPEKVILKGAIFDFRKSLLPVEFSVTNPKAMDYFESLEISQRNPIFTNVWGKQISESVVKRIVEESAFGEDYVRETKSSRKDYVITGVRRESYDFDSEETITVAELNELIAARETNLAAMKKRQDDYKNSKNIPAVNMSKPSGPVAVYDF